MKINFERQSTNISEILNEVAILAESALYIDDNPHVIVEVKSVHPHLRTLSAEHYDWRRIILLSPEMQVSVIRNPSQIRFNAIMAK